MFFEINISFFNMNIFISENTDQDKDNGNR